ncbi:MAG TPA: cyclopropane-fatty-acyl-phospholipid synthase family protein [Rhodanobacteraceae bacterium]|nr:cyclopropane-fatty-acyl-phospholipid synthase family protein [Rhodanobacteraceae bacterium]
MNAFVKQELGATSEVFPVLDRLLRERLAVALRRLAHGRLMLRDALGTLEFGDVGNERHPIVHVDVLDSAFYRALAASGSVGAGEAYMDGLWHCDDLVGLVRLLLRNRDLLDGMEGGLARLGSLALRGWHAFNRNTRNGSRRNIAAHYDLGNDFFRLFLSRDLMYSAAYWAEGDDLEAASTRKLDLICRKLQLSRDDHVLEIGTGWGGFALHAASHCGCRVTTTTISREQHALARERVAQAGLSDRVEVLLQDYRDLRGNYDKLVSIEMVEAIGAAYLPAYFAQIGRLLKPGGLALLQAITIEDHRYRHALKSVDFIKRFVFPGSFIPSLHAMLEAKTRASDLGMIGLEDFGDSYARTLQAWRERFLAHLPEARAQGFDERFLRMWEFYLAYCEGGFRERSIAVAHLLLAKPGWRRTQAHMA